MLSALTASARGSRLLAVTCSLQPDHRSSKRGPDPASAVRSGRAAPVTGSWETLLGLGAAPAAREIDQDQLTTDRLPALTLPLAAAGLAAVAGDVFLLGSLHLLQPLDAAAHAWVSTHLDLEMQRLVAGKLASDAAIMLGLCGWAAVAAAALQTRQPRLIQALGTSALAYGLGGGAIRHGDPLLVDALKHAFHRARPADYPTSFAFPSGHTTAATFICGTLLFVLLPLAVQALEEQQREQRLQPGVWLQQAAGWLEESRWWLWGAAVLLTAASRVAADAHWCSDTLAGACLGVALTAGTLQLCTRQAAGDGNGR